MVWPTTVGAGSQLGGSIPALARISHKIRTVRGIIQPRRRSGICIRRALLFFGLTAALFGFVVEAMGVRIETSFFQLSFWFCSATLIFAPSSCPLPCASTGDRSDCPQLHLRPCCC